MLSFEHDTLLVEPTDDGSVVTVRLNRPKALNALNRRLLEQLDQVLEALADRIEALENALEEEKTRH